MGRDFSIGDVESTVKPVSHIMFIILKEYDYFKNDKFHDKIKMKDLAGAIYNLEYLIELNPTTEDAKKEFVKQFGFYDSDTFEEVMEHVKTACRKLTECLIHETMIGCKFVIADYN